MRIYTLLDHAESWSQPFISRANQSVDLKRSACWRISEVENTVKNNDEYTISRLRRYHPFNIELTLDDDNIAFVSSCSSRLARLPWH